MSETQTITLEAISELFDNKIDEVMEVVGRGFAAVDERFDRVESSIHSLQEAHTSHFSLTRDIQRRVVTLEDSVIDVQDSMDFLSMAEDKDAEATINHELRIARLERMNNIETVSSAHLSDLD